MHEAGISGEDIDLIAVTTRPGLTGSLTVGLSFAKGLALGLSRPLVSVDHILAHMYAAQLEQKCEYPYMCLLVSGGHTVIARVDGFDSVTVLGTTIDDACGEAFDKIAKHYDLGYPGGVSVDRLARTGNDEAFRLPQPKLDKGDHPYDVSYSGLKTAAINQLEKFRVGEIGGDDRADIAASFERAAIDMLVDRFVMAAEDQAITRLVVGGGVAANTRLRERMKALSAYEVHIPSHKLCTDNAAMIAGLGYHVYQAYGADPLSVDVRSRVQSFRRSYP